MTKCNDIIYKTYAISYPVCNKVMVIEILNSGWMFANQNSETSPQHNTESTSSSGSSSSSSNSSSGQHPNLHLLHSSKIATEHPRPKVAFSQPITAVVTNVLISSTNKARPWEWTYVTDYVTKATHLSFFFQYRLMETRLVDTRGSH